MLFSGGAETGADGTSAAGGCERRQGYTVRLRLIQQKKARHNMPGRIPYWLHLKTDRSAPAVAGRWLVMRG
jgi:hypothetical protein